MKILETPRLILRVFEEKDLDSLTAINQDSAVMKYFPKLQTRDETYEAILRVKEHQQKYGFSFYAVELKSTHEMIGFIGIQNVNFDAHFTPAVEIGWRIASDHWNKGYATEAAKAVLAYAFHELNVDEIVSFAVESNAASCRIMQKIGMHHEPKDDFDHPKVANDSPLKKHVLYKISKLDFLERLNNA